MTTISKPKEYRSWSGRIPLHNVYTVGVSNEHFLRTIQRDGVLVASVCPPCKQEFVPPKMFCPYCLSELKDLKKIEARGTIETFTCCWVDQSGTPLKRPQIFAFIRMASAGGLIHKIGDIEAKEIEIGLKVEAVFKPVHQREGSILDIEYFRPTK